MKIAIITVAGKSSRFRKSLGSDVLKCIYYEESEKDSLLYHTLSKLIYDVCIIVGGYKFEDLKKYINEYCFEMKDKLRLVYNEHYAEYGSGYSLYIGLEEALKYTFDELLFLEGDLFVDDSFFEQIDSLKTNVLTINNIPISAKSSVVAYINTDGKIKYVYDSSHSSICITEPFQAIYNSGQIWKFDNMNYIQQSFYNITFDEWKKTNLIFIEKYFSLLNKTSYVIKSINTWINCNTVSDYRKAFNQQI